MVLLHFNIAKALHNRSIHGNRLRTLASQNEKRILERMDQLAHMHESELIKTLCASYQDAMMAFQHPTAILNKLSYEDILKVCGSHELLVSKILDNSEIGSKFNSNELVTLSSSPKIKQRILFSPSFSKVLKEDRNNFNDVYRLFFHVNPGFISAGVRNAVDNLCDLDFPDTLLDDWEK